MKNGVALLFMLAVVLVFLVLLLINAVKARQTEKSWFVAGAILAITIVWIVNFVRADFFT